MVKKLVALVLVALGTLPCSSDRSLGQRAEQTIIPVNYPIDLSELSPAELVDGISVAYQNFLTEYREIRLNMGTFEPNTPGWVQNLRTYALGYSNFQAEVRHDAEALLGKHPSIKYDPFVTIEVLIDSNGLKICVGPRDIGHQLIEDGKMYLSSCDQTHSFGKQGNYTGSRGGRPTLITTR